jgi:hypothetical protein
MNTHDHPTSTRPAPSPAATNGAPLPGGPQYSPPELAPADAELVSGFAALMMDAVRPFSIACAQLIHEHVDELPDDAETVEYTRQAAEGNPREVLSTMRAKLPTSAHETPVEAIEHVRFLMRRGVGAQSVIKLYQYGVAMYRHLVVAEIQDRIEDPVRRAVIMDWTDDYLFRFIDRCTSRLVGEYGLAEGNWYPTAGDPIFADPDTAEAARRLRDEEIAAGRWLAQSPQLSHARQDAERGLAAFAQTIEHAAADPGLSRRLSQAATVVEITLADEPDLSVTLRLDRTPVEVVDTDPAPEVRLSIASVDLNRIWSRDFHLPMAIAKGRVHVTGPVRKFLRVAPMLRVMADKHDEIWLSLQGEQD